MRTIPLLLNQASIVLYPQNSTGGAVTSAPIWFGARVEGLAMSGEIEEIPSTPSGAAYLEYEQGHEQYLIKIGRIWVIASDTIRPASLTRGKYVLDIIHEDPKKNLWHRYTYFNTTVRSFEVQSVGIMHYGEAQEFRSTRRTEDSGTLPSLPAPPIPYEYMNMITVLTLAELALTPGVDDGKGCFVNASGAAGGGSFRFYLGGGRGTADGWDLVDCPDGQWERLTSN